MKRFLSVFYIYLFFLIPCFSYSMTFNKKLLPTGMNKLPQLIDQKNIVEGKIKSPEFISICGQTIDCKNKTLEQVYKEIQDCDTNEEYTQFIEIIAHNKAPADYLQAVNDAILLSTTTAWGPDEYAGLTPQQIIDYMKKQQSQVYNNDKMFSSNPDVAAIMPQMIQDKVKELRAADLKPSSDSSSKSATTPSSVRVVSASEQANEWTFVFKAVYEKLPTAGATALVNVLSTENKNIGPQAKAILTTSIQNKKTYAEYLQDLLSAVEPVVINASSEVVSAPETINLNREDKEIIGKNSKELYDLVMSENGSKFAVIKNLERYLQPDQVKQDFMALCAENDYCMAQKTKIQEAISLFSQSNNTIKQPESFGDAWLIKPTEMKGTTKEVVIDPSLPQWVDLINKIKILFQPKLMPSGVYRLTELNSQYKTNDASLYAQEKNAFNAKAIKDKAASIIQSMQFKMDGNKRIKVNLYPSPMEAFNEAWNALYPSSGGVMIDGALKQLEDSENVDPVKQALLKLFAGMDFGNITKKISGDTGADTDEQLPEELVLAMKNYIAENKINVKEVTMLKVFSGTKNSFPQGWAAVGVNGIQTPSGGTIPMAKVIEAVKGKSGGGDEAGAMSEHHYNILLKYKDELDEKDNSVATVALRAGKTYKEYKDILAGGGASQDLIGISKEGYDTLLVKVQVEMNKKNKPSLMKIKMTFTITQDYKDLKLPADYADLLFPALMKNLSYEDFLSSVEYKEYLEVNKATIASGAASTPAQVPAKAPESTQVVVSKQLVDQAKYGELAAKMAGMSLRPNFTVKSVKMSLGITDESGIANNEDQFGLDKDKLAQALFDKKTFDEYIALCGGKPAQAVPASAEKSATPPVAPKTLTSPAAQKPSTAPGEEKKTPNGQVISDAKIFDDFKKSIKISNILFMEVAKDQLARS